MMQFDPIPPDPEFLGTFAVVVLIILVALTLF